MFTQTIYEYSVQFVFYIPLLTTDDMRSREKT